MRVTDYLRADIDHEFEQFLIGDANNVIEVWLRRLLILSVGGLLWLATQQTMMLVWCIGFVLIDLAYVRYLRNQTAPISKRQLIGAMFGSTLIGAWFAAMVLYVTTVGDGQYLLLAASGCVGIGLHCLSRNYHFSYSGYIQLATAVITGLGLSVGATLKMEFIFAGLVTLVGGLGVIVFFVVCFS
mgnify:CR=1 FL=1